MKITLFRFILINFYVLADAYFGQYMDSNPEEGNFHEGDIILRKSQVKQASFHGIPVTLSDTLPWPSKKIRYEIVETGIKTKQLEEIKLAFKEIEKVSCIKFIKKDKGTSSYIRIKHVDYGCAAGIGYSPQAKVTEVLLSENCGKGNIVHELFHALGFWHEQSRWDRDEHVQILYKNILKNHKGNFDKHFEENDPVLKLPYDYVSIMHYPAVAFENVENRLTIFPFELKYIKKMGQREILTDMDKQKVNFLYKCGQHSR